MALLLEILSCGRQWPKQFTTYWVHCMHPRVTLYTAGHLHTAVPHCWHSRAPIVDTTVPWENNEHGCVYLRCRAVCKLPGCVEGHLCTWPPWTQFAMSSYDMATLVSGHQQLYCIDVLLQEHPDLSSVWKDHLSCMNIKYSVENWNKQKKSAADFFWKIFV